MQQKNANTAVLPTRRNLINAPTAEQATVKNFRNKCNKFYALKICNKKFAINAIKFINKISDKEFYRRQKSNGFQTDFTST